MPRHAPVLFAACYQRLPQAVAPVVQPAPLSWELVKPLDRQRAVCGGGRRPGLVGAGAGFTGSEEPAVCAAVLHSACW